MWYVAGDGGALLATLSGTTLSSGSISLVDSVGMYNSATGDGGFANLGIGLLRGFKPQLVDNCTIHLATCVATANVAGGECTLIVRKPSPPFNAIIDPRWHFCRACCAAP